MPSSNTSAGVPVDEVSKTPIPGLYEMRIGTDVFYTDEQGAHLIDGHTLIPIAFVYNVSHYYTLALEQGARVLGLVSDPLGMSWNLFGTARKSFGVMLDIELVWHSQVWLILAGHIVSVYLAHLQALKIVTPRRAVVGQLPVLVLMVALTSLGLWILSLPIQSA